MTPAEQLVDALESMTAISERQSVSLAKSRERANRIRKGFYERLTWQSGGIESISDAMEPVDEMRASLVDSRKRETAILDAFRALMLLYKEPEKRSVADEVYSCLYQIRMIDVGDPATDLDFPQPIIPAIDPEQSVEERRKLAMDAFVGFDEQLNSSMESRQASQDDQIARSDALLAMALSTAKQLL